MSLVAFELSWDEGRKLLRVRSSFYTLSDTEATVITEKRGQNPINPLIVSFFMATKAIKHFRLRELARAPPLPPVPQPTSTTSPGFPFDLAKFELSQPTRVAPESSTNNFLKRANPFIPTKNPQTGRWAPPKYSLRQQADLIKKARASGTLALLPPAPKTYAAHLAAISFAKAQPASKKPLVQAGAETQLGTNTNGSEGRWSQPIEWVGEVKEHKVPGAEVGNRLYAGKKRMFKGHKWERVAEKKSLKRRMLMRDMAKRIQRYKQASIFFSPCTVSLQFLSRSITRGDDRTRSSLPRSRAGSFHSKHHVCCTTNCIGTLCIVLPVSCLVTALLCVPQIPIINSASRVNSPVTGSMYRFKQFSC